METRNFDRIATSLSEVQSRRDTFRIFGAALLGVGGVSLLAVEGEAKRGKKRKKPKKQDQDDPQTPTTPPTPVPFADIAITAVDIELLSEAGHDTVVVKYTNTGTLTATGFRIGMVAKRANGLLRQEEFSLPLTLAPGLSGVEKFRLGCNWINGGTVTVRTDPSPVPGESGAATANNTLANTFGTICS